MQDTSRISSVYYDTPSLRVYHDRLVREDGATLVRFRQARDGGACSC